MTPFFHNGYLSGTAMARTWVRLYVQAPVSVVVEISQGPGKPDRIIHVSFDEEGRIVK